MSQGLELYLLREEINRALPGSGDQRLLEEVLRVQARAIEGFDEHAADQWDEGEAPMTMAEAIAGLFSGCFDADYPYYGIAFEFVCSSLGEWLPNSGFCPCSVDLYPHVDSILAENGVPLRMTDLTHNYPIELPAWDDLLCGHWSSEEIRRAAPALAAALANPKNDPFRYLDVIQEWLQRAINKPGTMIVGCHS